MSNELSHKGYRGSCSVSIEDECLHGRIQDIDDLITYEGVTVPELEAAFKTAVDEYLDHCEQTGKEPNKPYSGSFNVRIGADLHKATTQRARVENKSLNEFVRNTLEKTVLSQPQQSTVRHEVTVNHIVKHEQVIETSYSQLEESSWQQPAEKPKLRVVR